MLKLFKGTKRKPVGKRELKHSIAYRAVNIDNETIYEVPCGNKKGAHVCVKLSVHPESPEGMKTLLRYMEKMKKDGISIDENIYKVVRESVKQVTKSN